MRIVVTNELKRFLEFFSSYCQSSETFVIHSMNINICLFGLTKEQQLSLNHKSNIPFLF